MNEYASIKLSDPRRETGLLKILNSYLIYSGFALSSVGHTIGILKKKVIQLLGKFIEMCFTGVYQR